MDLRLPRRVDLSVETLGSHDDRIEAIVPVGDAFVVASTDGAVALWPIDGAAPRLLANFDERALCVARDGADILVGTDAALHRVPLTGGATKTILDAAADDRVVVAIDARDGRLAVALHDEASGSDHPIVLMDGDGQPVWSATSMKWPYAIRFAPDGRSIAVPSWDGVIRRYAVDDGDLLSEYGDLVGGPLYDGAWVSPQRMAIASLAGGLTIWDVRAHREVSRRKTDFGLHAIAVSPSEGWLVAGGNTDYLIIVDLRADRASGICVLDGIAPVDPPDDEPRDRRTAFPSSAEYYQVSGDRAVTALAFHPIRPELLVGFQDGTLATVAITARSR